MLLVVVIADTTPTVVGGLVTLATTVIGGGAAWVTARRRRTNDVVEAANMVVTLVRGELEECDRERDVLRVRIDKLEASLRMERRSAENAERIVRRLNWRIEQLEVQTRRTSEDDGK